MNSQQLQTAIDKTVANITAATKSYNTDLYNISLKHAQKLMDIQVIRAGLLSERKAQEK